MKIIRAYSYISLRPALRSALIMLGLLLCVALPACDTDDEPDGPAVTVPGEDNGEGSNPGSETGDDLTTAVLVYMVADNSLGRQKCSDEHRLTFDECDLSEMQTALDAGAMGSHGRLFVYHSPYGTASGAVPALKELRPNNKPKEWHRYDDAEVYSTSPARMAQVIADFNALAGHAPHRGLVLWSHGTGWVADDGARSGVAERPLVGSFGDDRGVKMTLASLKRGLDGSNWDFIYFDACHMATVETAYALRDVARLMVGSVTELPSPGMPYNLNVAHFFAPEGPDALAAATTTFSYYDGQMGSARSCTMSVLNLQAMTALADATREIMAAGPVATAPAGGFQRFTRRLTNDPLKNFDGSLFDMEKYIESLTPLTPEALDAWRRAMADVVLYQAATPKIFNSITIKRHCGLACFIPLSPADAERWGYDDTEWFADVMAVNPNLQ